jgi:large subunit ribosomal protein L9
MIALHPEVEVPVTVNVARSADEAERQGRGEDLTRRDIFEEPEEEPVEPAGATAADAEGGNIQATDER